jgi:hypothetical protein
VTGDNKSSKYAKTFVRGIKSDYRIEYYDVDEQRAWYKKNGVEDNEMLIPYSSMRRRNLAYLIAYKEGADNILTIDDDNFALKNNVAQHLTALESHPYEVSSKNGIVNPCHLLRYNHDNVIYSRGYIISELFRDTFDIKSRTRLRVALNMGLWTGSPDVDSYTNIIYQDLRSDGLAKSAENSYAVAKGNYMPINVQNTMFRSRLLPAYYDLLMDHTIANNRLDRYDDIWPGYIINRIMHRFDETASFGVPLAAHLRNVHNYSSDLKHEFVGISMNTVIFNIIRNAEINAKTYSDCYLQMADEFELKAKFVHPEVDRFISNVVKAMRTWVDVVEGAK